jgi:hypothetical protein
VYGSRICSTKTILPPSPSPVSEVSLYYVAMGSIVLTAYDRQNQQIGQQVVGAANTDGIEPGSDSQISASGANIAYVTLGNIGLADESAFGDLSFTSQQASPVPEPGSLPLLLTRVVALAICKLLSHRRFGPRIEP